MIRWRREVSRSNGYFESLERFFGSHLLLYTYTPALFLAIISGCVVNSGVGTPAGFNCNPDANGFAQVASLLNSGTGLNSAAPGNTETCVTCDGNSPSGDSSRRSRFRLQVVTSDATSLKEDLCIVYLFGQLSQDQMIVTYPQNPKHSGGMYRSQDLADLITFVNTYRLPGQ